MKQIVITIKKENILTNLTDPNPLLPLAKRDCVTKNFETQVIQWRQVRTILKKRLIRHLEKHVINQNP